MGGSPSDTGRGVHESASPLPLRWIEEGCYWRGPEFPNAWGQTGFYVVEIERAEGENLAGESMNDALGVYMESLSSETFLLPGTALAFAARVRRVATQAQSANARVSVS